MKRCLSFVAMVAMACSGVAQGHAHLQSSEPANASMVNGLMKNIVLHFNEPVQLTALTVQKGDAAAQKLGSLPDVAAKSLTVPLPELSAGTYVLAWRAIGDDGHVVSGKVSFTVTGAVAPAAAAGKAL